MGRRRLQTATPDPETAPESAPESDHIGRDPNGDDHWQQPPDLTNSGHCAALALVMGKGAKAYGALELSLLHSFAFFSRRLVANSGHNWQVVV